MNFLIPTFYFDDVVYDIASQYHRHSTTHTDYIIFKAKYDPYIIFLNELHHFLSQI